MIEKGLLSWEQHIKSSAFEEDSVIVVLISENGKVLSKNENFKNIIPYFSIQNIINPGFEKIKKLPFIENSLIFKDYITIGNYSSNANLSLKSYIYKRNGEYLIVANLPTKNIIEQNRKLNDLVSENTDLQRQLIRNKKKLENTLQELDKLNHELKKQIQTKDKIFSIISHDIRSPFSGILGISELLKDNLDTLSKEEISKFVTHLDGATQSYHILITNLLEWASLQLNKYTFRPEKNNIYSLILNVYRVLIENANKKKITIEVNIPQELVFYVDTNMFLGIVRNLVSNAIKFTPKHGKIEVSAHIDSDHLHLSVTDSGVGITKEKIRQILRNELVRSTVGTENEKGTGLGLSLCKEFIDIHGGKLQIESSENSGTSFNIAFPDINKN